jgi:hypothetical protein
MGYIRTQFVHKWTPNVYADFGRTHDSESQDGTQQVEGWHKRLDTVVAPPTTPPSSLPEFVRALLGEAKYTQSLVSNPVSFEKHKEETAKASAQSTADRSRAIEWLREEKRIHGCLKLKPTGSPGIPPL